MPVKACPKDGHPYYVGRCPVCQADRYRARPKTNARGLGADHRRRRERLRRAQPFGPCWLCGKEGSWNDPKDPLTADHVLPRSAGGRGSELRPAHRSCNSSRGAKALFGELARDRRGRLPSARPSERAR